MQTKYFLEEVVSHGKIKINVINSNSFLLPSLQLWRQSGAGTPALLSPFIDLRRYQCKVLQLSLYIESSRRVINKNWPYCPLDPPAKGIDFRFVLEVDERCIWKDLKCRRFMLFIRRFTKCQEQHRNASGRTEQHPSQPVLAHRLLPAPSISAFRHQESATKVFSVYKEHQNNQIWFWFIYLIFLFKHFICEVQRSCFL